MGSPVVVLTCTGISPSLCNAIIYIYEEITYNAQDNNSSCYRIAIAIYYYPYQKCFNKRFGLTIEPLPKKSNLMSVQRMKNEGADQPANFSTLVIR